MSELTLLERVNAVPISSDELTALLAASDLYMQEHPEEAASGTAALMLAAKQAGSAERGVALWSRMSALAQLIDEDGHAGWTLPSRRAGGGVLSQAVLFAAAAVHPLVEKDDAFIFDRESLIVRAEALAASEPDPRT